MIGYLYLTLSSFCVAILSILRKKYEKYNGNNMLSTLLFVFLYSIIVSGFAFLISDVKYSFDFLTLILSILLAISVASTTIICIIGVEYGPVSVLVLFATMGSISISSFYSLIFDGKLDDINIFNIIGFLIIAFIIVLNFISSEKNKKSRLKFSFLCFIVFFTNGLALLYFSLFTRYRPLVGNSNFLGTYSLLTALLSIIIFLILYLLKKKKNITEKAIINKKSYWCIFLYALTSLISELVGLKCTTILPLYIQAPLSFSLPVIFTIVLDAIFFKVKIDLMNIIKILLAISASVMFVI